MTISPTASHAAHSHGRHVQRDDAAVERDHHQQVAERVLALGWHAGQHERAHGQRRRCQLDCCSSSRLWSPPPHRHPAAAHCDHEVARRAWVRTGLHAVAEAVAVLAARRAARMGGAGAVVLDGLDQGQRMRARRRRLGGGARDLPRQTEQREHLEARTPTALIVIRGAYSRFSVNLKLGTPVRLFSG